MFDVSARTSGAGVSVGLSTAFREAFDAARKLHQTARAACAGPFQKALTSLR